MKDIFYITLKVEAAQNVSIQNNLKTKQNKKKFNFLTINGPAKARATQPLPLALKQPQFQGTGTLPNGIAGTRT